ncbi:uncharacterized protein EV422DRAFT_507987 [Fimicolochytrium jonesii]|uniref:uncharacterized protein n=1 Tax=Fimicolochytrium jonesii TaxID=1396493 RepID=UPI0022FE67D1|nr:uncharacterized protein EV422DRAFT_507987 [Fimicolochytrium jonesii]KAI8818833.1 hypothetical protein EV422DRAFT_507987 [Fimicolochytrium jonesii]
MEEGLNRKPRTLLNRYKKLWNQRYADEAEEKRFQAYFSDLSRKHFRFSCITTICSALTSGLSLLVHAQEPGTNGFSEISIWADAAAIIIIVACAAGIAIAFVDRLGSKMPTFQQLSIVTIYAVIKACSVVLVFETFTLIDRHRDIPEGSDTFVWNAAISARTFLYSSGTALYGSDCLRSHFGLMCASIDLIAAIVVFSKKRNVDCLLFFIVHLTMVAGPGLAIAPSGEKTRRAYYRAMYLGNTTKAGDGTDVKGDGLDATAAGGHNIELALTRVSASRSLHRLGSIRETAIVDTEDDVGVSGEAPRLDLEAV